MKRKELDNMEEEVMKPIPKGEEIEEIYEDEV